MLWIWTHYLLPTAWTALALIAIFTCAYREHSQINWELFYSVFSGLSEWKCLPSEFSWKNIFHIACYPWQHQQHHRVYCASSWARASIMSSSTSGQSSRSSCSARHSISADCAIFETIHFAPGRPVPPVRRKRPKSKLFVSHCEGHCRVYLFYLNYDVVKAFLLCI